MIFGHDERKLRRMTLQEKEDEKKPKSSRLCLLQRQTVEVDVETSQGSIESVQAQTYVWTNGIHDLDNIWEEDRFIRSKPMQSILGEGSASLLSWAWIAQEQSLASTMNMSFALVGDYLCGPILAGNIQELAVLIRSGIDVNAQCRIYGRPLQAAIVHGKEDMVRLLLDHGANINDPSEHGQYGTPLIAAAYSGRKKIAKLLLHRGANIYQGSRVHVNALYQAVSHSDYAFTEILLEHGAWLCKEWREIRDLAEEVADEEIQDLIEAYDVRKMHMKFLQKNEYDERIEPSADDVYNDNLSVRLVKSQEKPKADTLEYKAISWGSVSLSKIGVAVLRKTLIASRMSGSWKGKRGVVVVLAALNAGAPKRLLELLRGVVNPLHQLIQMLVDAQENGDRTMGEALDIWTDEFRPKLGRSLGLTNGSPDRSDSR